MSDTPKTPEDVKRLVRDNDIKIVDLKFTDLPGTFQHFSIPRPSSTTTCSKRVSGSTVHR